MDGGDRLVPPEGCHLPTQEQATASRERGSFFKVQMGHTSDNKKSACSGQASNTLC